MDRLPGHEAGSSPLRDVIKRELESGESVIAEGEILDLGLGGLPAYLIVTKERILWVIARRPDTVMQMRFRHVSEMGARPDAVKLTERDPEYAASLNDSANPYGETDAMFGLPQTDEEKLLGTSDLKDAIYTGVVRLSPLWREWREGVSRFKERRGRAVSSWDDCPICFAPISSRTLHVVQCRQCNRYFSDPGYQPVVGESAPDHVRDLIDEAPWRPLLETQFGFVGKTLPWIPPPPWVPAGPIEMPDSSVSDFADGTF